MANDIYINPNYGSQPASDIKINSDYGTPTSPPPSSANNSFSSYVNAGVLGLTAGALDYGSTIEKAINYVSGLPEGANKYLNKIGLAVKTRKDIQDEYNSSIDDYNNNPDAKAHPIVAGAGRLAGNALITAPLLAAAPVSGAATEAGQLLSSVTPAIAKGTASAVGNFATNAAANGLFGGLSNSKDQDPNQLFNDQNAKNAIVAGGALQAGAAPIGQYLKNTSALENLYDTLSKNVPDKFGPSWLGASSKSLSTSDMSGLSGMGQWLSQKVLNPLLSNIPVLGSNVYKQQKVSAVQDYVNEALNNLAGGDRLTTLPQITQQLSKTSEIMHNAENNQWSQVFPKALKDSNINSVPVSDQTLDLISQVKQLPKSYLSDSVSTRLQSLEQNQSMNPQDLIQLKRDLYPQQLLKQLGSSTIKTDANDQQAANSMMSLYDNLNGDIRTAVSGTPAEQAFEHANQYTIANHHFFDNNLDPVAKAMQTSNDYGLAANKLVGQLLAKGVPQQLVKTGQGMLGEEGSNALAVSSIIKNSYDKNGNFDINKYLTSVNSATPARKLVDGPVTDALQGLQTILPSLTNSSNSIKTLGEKALGAAGVGGAVAGGSMISGPIAAAAAVAPPTLSYILQRAPIKNTLIKINQVADNPELSQYFIKNAYDMLSRAGVFIASHDDGTKVLTHNENK